MNIIVISMAGIGDALLATPLIRELRANYPDARIDSLVLWAGSRDILERNPNINTVFQRNLFKQSSAASFRFLWSVRKNGYDISINTHPQSRRHYRLIARIIRAPARISHVYESFGPLDHLLVNRTLPQHYDRHSVENNLDMLSLLGKQPLLPKHELEIFLSPADDDWAASFLSEHKIEGCQILGIHPGSGGTKNLALKRWPLNSYIELVRQLRRNCRQLAILLFGGPDESADIEQILAADKSPLSVRVKSGTLRQAGALMRRCTAFLSVDTALMHVAAAVKAPRQIVIEAPTLNKTNEPYANPYTLVRNPAVAGRNLEYYRYDGQGIKGTREELIRCMDSVTVEAVYKVVQEQLEQ
jgi:lipopolysaccharide heptosyltransferase II